MGLLYLTYAWLMLWLLIALFDGQPVATITTTLWRGAGWPSNGCQCGGRGRTTFAIMDTTFVPGKRGFDGRSIMAGVGSAVCACAGGIVYTSVCMLYQASIGI